MISSTSMRTIPRLSEGLRPRLDWSEVTVRCHDDISEAVADVMRSMEDQPFSATDGIAVQLATTEALETVFKRFAQETSDVVQLRFVVSPERVWIEINAKDANSAQADSSEDRRSETSARKQDVSLVRSLMSSVEYRNQGRQILLSRGRGQGAVNAGPPSGYDFQI